jgi:F-type H+-transporting ATPase subunit b
MLIDWFTVVAQAINFLILVWLMKRYLYQPIQRALAAREAHIAAELSAAEKSRHDATAELEEYQRKNEEFERRRATLLSRAKDEASMERQRLFDEARKDADTMRTKLNSQFSNEYHDLHEELMHRTQVEIFAIARQTLTDLAGVDLEERMVQVFLERLQNLGQTEQERINTIVARGGALSIHSAFPFTDAQRTAIERAIRAVLRAESIAFEVAPNLICGIELVIGGKKVAWSVSDNLASLERGLASLLKERHISERHEN